MDSDGKIDYVDIEKVEKNMNMYFNWIFYCYCCWASATRLR